MEKIQGYDEAEALTGEYEVLKPGKYICKIVNAREELSAKSGRKMLVIEFDIADGEHKDFYKRKHQEALASNTEAKWSGVYRQMLEGEKAAGFLKGMMTSLSACNPKFKWDWDESKLVGLKFGGLFGREQYKGNDGNLKFATKLRFIRSINGLKDAEIPADKLLPAEANMNPYGWEQVNDENLPF